MLIIMQKKFKTLVINLDSSTDRLEHCKQILGKQKIYFERISAVYGKSLSDEDLYRYYDKTLNIKQYHKSLNTGEIGCYLSHRKAWQKIIDDKLDFAVILEDDVVINGDFASAVQAISELTIEWDYIKLSEHKRKRNTVWQQTIGNYALTVFDKIPTLACAQVVSLRGARKLLTCSERFGRPVDVDIQYWWKKNLQVFGLNPFIFSPANELPSDIHQQKTGKGYPSRRFDKLKQQVKFKWANYRATQVLLKHLEKKS